MSKKFESKKLNKEDHAKVDKDAGIARGVVESVGALGLCLIAVKKVPWRKVSGAIGKVVFRG